MFNLIKNQENIVDSGWLEGLCEIHCHLLPGVDDGSRSTDESLEILGLMKSIGFNRVTITPHLHHRYPDNTAYSLREKFQSEHRLREMSPLPLSLASEYMLDDRYKDHLAEGQEPLTLTSSGKILVETSMHYPSMVLLDMLFFTSSRGFDPIIAHPERYLYFEEEQYQELFDRGYYFQLNIFSLTGMYGDLVKKRAHWLLKKGYYSVVATDTHRIEAFQRECNNAVLPKKLKPIICELVSNTKSL